MSALQPRFCDCKPCGFPTLHHHKDPGWECTQCGAENQEPDRGASQETNIRAAVREANRTLRAPGAMDWIEKFADLFGELPDRITDHYHRRMFALITDFGREIGMDLDHIDKARIAASFLIGEPGDDDPEPEPEPEPAPRGDEKARA